MYKNQKQPLHKGGCDPVSFSRSQPTTIGDSGQVTWAWPGHWRGWPPSDSTPPPLLVQPNVDDDDREDTPEAGRAAMRWPAAEVKKWVLLLNCCSAGQQCIVYATSAPFSCSGLVRFPNCHKAGWQELCERANGVRRKVWTRTKILSPT